MSWDAIGALGQLLGSIAVLVSIVYLAIQVRSAKDEVARSARQARTDGLREFWLTRASEPELAAANAKLLAALGATPQPFIDMATDAGLSEAEAWQVLAMEWARWVILDQNVASLDKWDSGTRVQAQDGMLVYGRDGVSARWYAMHKSILNPDTVRHIDDLLERRRNPL